VSVHHDLSANMTEANQSHVDQTSFIKEYITANQCIIFLSQTYLLPYV